jgi:phage shock protein A
MDAVSGKVINPLFQVINAVREMEADPINVLLYDIREMKKRLDEMERELLKLKARLVEEEEGESPEEIETLEREALEDGKDWEALKKELGL